MDLGASDDTERGAKFWNVSSVQMKFTVERQWIKAVPKVKRKPNYGTLNMDTQLEEVVRNKLELVGPMINSYLQEIGKSMKCKLSRSKVTGLVNPASFFIPWTVFRHLLVLVRGYSGDVHTLVDGLKHVLTLTKMDSVREVFSPSRFSEKLSLSKGTLKRFHPRLKVRLSLCTMEGLQLL